MSFAFKTAVVALAIASATLTSGCMTRDTDHYGYSDHHRRDRDNAQLSVDFGNIGYGYSDGYWDNGHQWHQWSSNADRDNYSHHHGSRYYNWNHDRDGNDGWHGN